MKQFFWVIEDIGWNFRCRYNFWLHGPYGLAKVVEKMPFRFIIKYLRKYGATIGKNCQFERGINIHRPLGKEPFENLIIDDGVYFGHNILVDLTKKIHIHHKVAIGARCQIWTHTGFYKGIEIKDPCYNEYQGEVNIEEGAIIYSNVIIMQGTNIGKFARVGANSLVNKNVPAEKLVGGVPAKSIN